MGRGRGVVGRAGEAATKLKQATGLGQGRGQLVGEARQRGS